MTSAMPTGGTDAADPAVALPTSGGGGAVWLPPFKTGAGNPGVFMDARGLINGSGSDGSTPQITGQTVADNADAIAAAAATAAIGATGGVGPLDVGGPVAGTMPTGGSGGLTPKASSQAQRDANNAAASAAYPGYKGAG